MVRARFETPQLLPMPFVVREAARPLTWVLCGLLAQVGVPSMAAPGADVTAVAATAPEVEPRAARDGMAGQGADRAAREVVNLVDGVTETVFEAVPADQDQLATLDPVTPTALLALPDGGSIADDTAGAGLVHPAKAELASLAPLPGLGSLAGIGSAASSASVSAPGRRWVWLSLVLVIAAAVMGALLTFGRRGTRRRLRY